ncbi:MAG: phage tail protein [Spirochaetes bacterium]|nr:phage tail protein [Spirochaetota bacterium]
MGIDQSAISRVIGVDVAFKHFEVGRVMFLPQRVALIGQGNSAKVYSTEKTEVTSAAEVAAKYGYGSPLHLAARQLFPRNGDGIGSIPVTVYPLVDAGTGVPAAGSIAATGTQAGQGTLKVLVNKIQTAEIVVADAEPPATTLGNIKSAIDAVLEMPVITGTVSGGSLPLTAKWDGVTGNDIYIEIEQTGVDFTFTVTQPTGGAVNPDIDDALDLIGPVWETIILNLLNYNDTTTLDKLSTYGEGRWGELEKKPCWAASGCTAVLATRTAVTDSRKTDRINALIVAPGSRELPFVVAARGVARIAPVAQNNPARNYCGRLTGLSAGADSSQETYTQRNQSVLKGSSTSVIVDGEIELNDTITMYHPDGEADPGYRYVCDIVKLQNIVYNIRLIFESNEWKGAPLLPDSTPTINKDAKKPKDAKTALGNLAYNLALHAILADFEYTQDNMTASINSQNPKRLDTTFPVKISGNTEIVSTDLLFGFYFGQVA